MSGSLHSADSFNRHRGSRTSRTTMGVRVVVGEGEPIGAALRRLRQQLERAGVQWWVRRRLHFVRDAEIRRAKEFRKRFKAREATLRARVESGLDGPALDAAKAAFWRRKGKP